MKKIIHRWEWKETKKNKKFPQTFDCSKCWCIFSSDEYYESKKNFLYYDKCPRCRREVIVLY